MAADGLGAGLGGVSLARALVACVCGLAWVEHVQENTW